MEKLINKLLKYVIRKKNNKMVNSSNMSKAINK